LLAKKKSLVGSTPEPKMPACLPQMGLCAKTKEKQFDPKRGLQKFTPSLREPKVK